MLNFPGWKVALIGLVLLWGTLMALPNAFSDGFLGIDSVNKGPLTGIIGLRLD